MFGSPPIPLQVKLIYLMHQLSPQCKQGVLGVKSYFSTTPKSYKDFHFRFRVMFHLQYLAEPVPEPGTSAMQAYDTAWAVAIALVGKPYVKLYKFDRPCYLYARNEWTTVARKNLAKQFLLIFRPLKTQLD